MSLLPWDPFGLKGMKAQRWPSALLKSAALIICIFAITTTSTANAKVSECLLLFLFSFLLAYANCGLCKEFKV